MSGSEFLPDDAVLSWINPAGTLALTADYRKFGWKPTQVKHAKISGPSANVGYVLGDKDFTCTYNGYGQAGGTAAEDQLALGTHGTLIWQPEGTAAGKRKFTFPCFTDSAPITDWDRGALVEINASWQGEGAWIQATN